MKGDFTRDTFDPTKHYSRVLMQQGRVQLDADWNEQASILLHHLQTLAADLIGPFGGPKTNLGFKISVDPKLKNDFFIGSGRYYVDGILCELDAEILQVELLNDGMNPTFSVLSLLLDNNKLVTGDWVEIKGENDWHPAQIKSIDSDKLTITVDFIDGNNLPKEPAQLRRLITYKRQQDYPSVQEVIEENGTYLVYLDVWERHIATIEDSSIREIALNGPDTSTRAKVVWQVKIMPTLTKEEKDSLESEIKNRQNKLAEIKNLHDLLKDKKQQAVLRMQMNKLRRVLLLLKKRLNVVNDSESNIFKQNPSVSDIRMAARVKPEEPNTDPCTIELDSKYRGIENQLYRVEIHDVLTDENGDLTTWTIKWSRDNGSRAMEWLGINNDGGLLIKSTYGFDVGDWIEIIDKDQELLGQPGDFFKIERVEDGAIYVDTTPTWDKNLFQKIRHWDQKSTGEMQLVNGAIQVTEGQWIDLEDGVQVCFEAGSTYRSGDYWQIPARAISGQIEWPKDGEYPAWLLPRGIRHHYAPLALFTWDGSSLVLVPNNGDCRCTINPAGNCPQQK